MSDKIPYEELSRRAIADVDAAFGTAGPQGNAENTSRTAPGLTGYRGQPAENDGTAYYGRCQAGDRGGSS